MARLMYSDDNPCIWPRTRLSWGCYLKYKSLETPIAIKNEQVRYLFGISGILLLDASNERAIRPE